MTTTPGVGSSNTSGFLEVARGVREVGGGRPLFRPGLSRGCRQRIGKRTAVMDSSRCLGSLRCAAGSAWDIGQAEAVREHVSDRVRLAGPLPRSLSQEEAARMVLRSRAGYEAASEVTAVPFRDAPRWWSTCLFQSDLTYANTHVPKPSIM